MNGVWKQTILALPGIGVSLLPKLLCPACWPAYAGLLSSVGLGFLVSTAYLLPLTIAFLALALAALVFRANKRRGYIPFLLGLAGAAGILLGKFAWEANYVLYAAVGVLVVASLWNTWPRHAHQAATCPDCEAKRVR
jgi:mercuric ion transport protein